MLKKIWDEWKGPLLLLLVCTVLAAGKTMLHDMGQSCIPADIFGVGTDGTSAYVESASRAWYQWDWDKKWVKVDGTPEGVTPFTDGVPVQHEGITVWFTPLSDDRVMVGNTFTTPVCVGQEK